MLLMNVRDAQGIKSLIVSFLSAKDGGREVRFAVLDPRVPVRLSEIVATSVALGTQRYNIQTLSADIAEQALSELIIYSAIPNMLYEATQRNDMDLTGILSLYHVKITSGDMTLEQK